MELRSQLKLLGPKSILLAAAVIGLLTLSLTVDLMPRFHFGDSGVFLFTGYNHYIPDNRSWTYGLALGWMVRTTHSLLSLPLCQIFLSWAAFALFAAALGSATKLKYPWVIALFLIGCLEPLGYYWSRSFMSDSAAQSVFVVLCAVLISRIGLLPRFLLLLILSFVLVSLRTVYFLPVLAALIVALAFRYIAFRAAQRKCGATLRFRDDSLARPWATAVAALILANLCYAVANTAMTHGRSLSTNIGDMAFLAGALSPLMGDQLGNTPLTGAERANLPRLSYENRLFQTFGSRGLVRMIHRHLRSEEAARPIMQRLVVNAIREHPGQLVRLVFRQWSDYLNPVLVVHRQMRGFLSGAVSNDGTPVILSDALIGLLGTWKVSPLPARDLPTTSSPALLYLERAGGVWALILSWYATFGFVVVNILARPKDRTFLIFASCFAFCYMALIAFAANQLVTRYLLPLDVPLLYSVGLCLPARAENPPSLSDARPGNAARVALST